MSEQPEGLHPGRQLKKSRRLFLLLAGCGLSALIFLMVCSAAISGILIIRSQIGRDKSKPSAIESNLVTQTPHPLQPVTRFPEVTDTVSSMPVETATMVAQTRIPVEVESDLLLAPPMIIRQDPIPPSSWLHLRSLSQLEFPPRDYYQSAIRLNSAVVRERTITRQPFTIGDRQVFRTDEGQVEAELMAITNNAYFWVESSLNYDVQEVVDAAQHFEGTYYPLVTALFGYEWRPGVDNDPHFSILHLDGYSTDGELGFFNSGDEYPWGVTLMSNQQEIVYLNMANLALGDDLYQGTLIHEVQHLIQWNNDPNESAWLDEGLAQFTELYTGFDTVDTMADYLQAPDTQLNAWNYDDQTTLYSHYGASYLFSVYFWEQLGAAAVRELSQHPADGLAGVEAVLGRYAPKTSLTQFMTNWAVANYLDDLSIGPEYGYANLRLPRPAHELEIDDPFYSGVNTIHQNGVHYVQIERTGEVTISFAGDTVTELAGFSNATDKEVWFAPAADEIHASLTGEIDLSATDTATLSFLTWYDLEQDYDFAYVTISIDAGENWTILRPLHGTNGEFGPAFGGSSSEQTGDDGGWLPESIDLSMYAGGLVQVSFEVLTDAAVKGGGFALDGISVPELGYTDDGESEGIQWNPRGFVSTGAYLPQPWSVTLLLEGESTQVIPLQLNPFNQGSWIFDLGQEGATLVIAALNPVTDSEASYWLKVE